MLRTSQKKIICLAIKTSELSHINLLNCIHTNIPGLPLSISWPEITSEMSNISTKSDVSYIPLTVHCRCITIRGKKVDKLFSRHTDTDDRQARLGVSTHQIFLHLLRLLGPHQAVHLLVLLHLLGLNLTLRARPPPYSSSL